MTVENPHYQTAMNLHRPRHNPQSIKTKIAIAQSNSAKARNTKITLPTPEWEKGANKLGKEPVK